MYILRIPRQKGLVPSNPVSWFKVRKINDGRWGWFKIRPMGKKDKLSRTKLPVERLAIWAPKTWNSEVRGHGNNTIHTWKSLGTQPSKHSAMFRGCWTIDYRTFEYGLGDFSMVLEPNCKAPQWLTQEAGPLPYCKGKHQHSWHTTAPSFNDSAIS